MVITYLYIWGRANKNTGNTVKAPQKGSQLQYNLPVAHYSYKINPLTIVNLIIKCSNINFLMTQDYAKKTQGPSKYKERKCEYI